jgi:hypothetical protein
MHPAMVYKLIFYARKYGGKESIPANPQTGQAILSYPQTFIEIFCSCHLSLLSLMILYYLHKNLSHAITTSNSRIGHFHVSLKYHSQI